MIATLAFTTLHWHQQRVTSLKPGLVKSTVEEAPPTDKLLAVLASGSLKLADALYECWTAQLPES